MIYITQGHEKSISLEILIKSFILLPIKMQKYFCLITFKDNIVNILNILKINYVLENDGISLGTSFLKCHFLRNSLSPQSTTSILKALELIRENKDILITLPTSKDQLIFKNKIEKGHTEFFRRFYDNEDLSMVFSSGNENILLISDHIPLKEVPSYINKKRIIKKITTTLEEFEHYFNSISEIILTGLNPHAGENGLLGTEEEEIRQAISSLKILYPRINFQGPIPGDGLHLMKRQKKSHQLYVYMYHDQGLSPFKQKYGLIGLHITFGLPFLRMSVDHGTGFDLFGKNKANPMGCYHLLKKSVEIQNKFS